MQRHRQATFGPRVEAVEWFRDVTRQERQSKALQNSGEIQPHLQHAKRAAHADAGAGAKWDTGKFWNRAVALGAESLRLEPPWRVRES